MRTRLRTVTSFRLFRHCCRACSLTRICSMRLWLVLVVLVCVLVEVQGKNRSRPDGENRREKKRRGQGQSRSERSRPLKIRLIPSPSVSLLPSKVLLNLAEQKSQYNVIPVPSSPGGPVTPLTQEEIQSILWREEEEQREAEARLRRKEEEKMRRRKARKEREEKQRALVEERRREEERVLLLLVEKEEEEWKRHLEEEERRREEAEEKTRQLEKEEEERRNLEEEERTKHLEEEEQRRRHLEEEERIRQEEEERREAYERRKQEEAKAREAREEERKVQEERRKEEHMREVLRGLGEGEGEGEGEEEWLRGDVFQMLHNTPNLLPAPLPQPPAPLEEGQGGEEEVKPSIRTGLPPGCSMSDVTVTCDNAKLTYFPPLALSQLKSLSLEGNSIRSLPDEAFNGIPNLEWINLGKNKLTSGAVGTKAFRGLRFLKRLYLDGNLLEAVPSYLPRTLQELKINENRLRELNKNSFRELGSLAILELEGNHLSEGNVDPLAFSSLKQLSYLRLGRNHFRTIPQGLPSTLLELYLENNMIEEISDTVFNHTSNLNLISLRHNKLDETRIAPLAWINHRNLESIDLSHNELYLVPSYLPRSLVHLVLVGNNIERIPGYVLAHMEPGLEYLYLSYNRLDGEGIEPESFFGSYHSMMELCLDHNQLVTVPPGISEMSNLHFLRLNNNRIRSIPDNGICDQNKEGESNLVAVRLDNNFIDLEEISDSAFSCVRPSTGVTLKPQYK